MGTQTAVYRDDVPKRVRISDPMLLELIDRLRNEEGGLFLVQQHRGRVVKITLLREAEVLYPNR